MKFLRDVKDFFIPSPANAFRPTLWGRQPLLLLLGVILVTEGFLVMNLFGRYAMEDFLAAVVGSEIIELTNAERAHARVEGLQENELLALAAQRKAEDMAKQGYFSHLGPDGKLPWVWVAEAGYDYHFAGENLAVRFVDSGDVVEAWMASPSHRANIVKPFYTEIGVGVAQGSYKGSAATYVVQFFGAPQGSALAAAPGAAPSTSFMETLSRTFMRMFAEPRATTALVLGGVAAVLIVGLLLTFFVHIQVQPGDLLLKGSLVALFALFLIVLNARVLLGPVAYEHQAASAALSLQNSVVLSERGESTQRFVVKY